MSFWAWFLDGCSPTATRTQLLRWAVLSLAVSCESLKEHDGSTVGSFVAHPHPPRWRIRFSSAKQMGFVAAGSITDRIESDEAWARKFDSREAAVAHVLRYIDALIVSSVDHLSITCPSCFIEELP